MIGELSDKLLGIVSPLWGLKRSHARATLKQITLVTGQGGAGYAAGKISRLSGPNATGLVSENGIPRANISNCRALSYQLYRDNPSARKICRQLESKVIGRGMMPSSEATTENGDEHTEFRLLARKIWLKRIKRLDYRGRPGFGGQSFTNLAKTALRTAMLGGEVLYRFRLVDTDTLMPTRIQLLSADRLANIPAEHTPSNHLFFFGVETDEEDIRKAYHFYTFHPSDPRAVTAGSKIIRIPASEVGHVFVSEDVEQLRGVPWFSAALLKMRDTNDYEFNELKAAAISACVVLGYRRSAGQVGFGLSQPDDAPLVDADGNRITAMQPGMIMDMGRTGEIQGFNPQRPNSSADKFITHLVRSQAAAVPGIKSSSLTQDYRQSSFSSERSADNDAWPELEDLQDWFSSSFYHPIYEKVITEAVAAGLFNDVVQKEEFLARKEDFLSASWVGPVQRSINPVDDAEASRKRVQNGQSSPQIEASSLGRDWREVVSDVVEYIDYCTEHKLPQDYIDQSLGIDQKDEPVEESKDKKPKTDPAKD